MAVFIPPLSTISRFKVSPTDGEWTLLKFLESNLDDSFEVYFNPYLNGDRPDVLIMKKESGVMIIEVKDWNLYNFRLNEKKKWVYIPNGAVVKSPVNQVFKYKENLYDLHVDHLLQLKINDFRNFMFVSCAVYFHCASKRQIDELLITPYTKDRKYQDFLRFNIDLIGRDSLTKDTFCQIIRGRRLDIKSLFFTPTIYESFKRILFPARTLIEDPYPINYSDKQRELIYSKNREQRVKGVFGSGKTTVLAARAVQAYKRALQHNSNPRILILTFNITLKNFIHDKLNRIEEDFSFSNFTIINYHQFIKAELNNLNIDFVIPENIRSEQIPDYLERNYFGNINLFRQHQHEIVKYDAVLIDEIQDYHRSWMDIIKECFRNPEGDYVLFGDVKQNIYKQPTQNKDVVTNVKGVNELKECFRSDFKVQDLAIAYQTNIFKDKYDIDILTKESLQGMLNFEKDGYINYMYLQNTDTVSTLYNIIRGNILNKVNNIAPNDITILGFTTKLLRQFDCYYRYASREKTNCMLESIELMYMIHLNHLGKQLEKTPWLDSIASLFKNKLFPNRSLLYDNDLVKLRQRIAILFALYDLYCEYKDVFSARLEEECKKCGITIQAFLDYRMLYKDCLDSFVKNVYSDDYKFYRDNKKLHFWFNSGTIKISTINSFKGWESNAVFLILEKKYEQSTLFNIAFDELLYTGITRCRNNLIVINFGNEEYHNVMQNIIQKIK